MKIPLLTFFSTISLLNFSHADVDLSYLKNNLRSDSRPGVQIKSVKPTPIKGIYQVQINSKIIYLSQDGKIVLTGDMYNLEKNISYRDSALNRIRQDVLDRISDGDKIIYKAKNEKYKITVFTDITCPYCQQLHKNMPQYLDEGITIAYLAYPRSGIGSKNAENMQKIWCADDRAMAMTKAMEKNIIPKASCAGEQVKQQFLLGVDFGVNATPTIIMSDGSMQAGLIPPKELASMLARKFPKTKGAMTKASPSTPPSAPSMETTTNKPAS